MRAIPGLLGLLLCAFVLGSEAPYAPPPPAPMVGFSYSPNISTYLGRDPGADLSTLLTNTNPDLVRLPVYWDSTEVSPGTLDFTVTDELLQVVADHNRTAARQTRVILTIGARNFLYPELHAPAWAGPREQPELDMAQQGADYRDYFDATLMRYRSSPLLYAWQVENEPFDYVVNEVTGGDQITPEQMAWEIAQAHHVDPVHRVVTTSFDGWNEMVDWMQVNASFVLWLLKGYPSGHPGDALAAGDALGLDIYVAGPSTPFRFASVSLRTSWKAEAITYWSALARAQGKQVWLTEMQAQPWATDPTGFSTDDLLASARIYRNTPLQVVLLWGAETWLGDPAWMQAASTAMGILKS